VLSFSQHGRRSWLERVPELRLALAVLLAFLAVVLHFPILFNGLAPAFGVWVTGLPGIVGLTAAIALSLLLAWGITRGAAGATWAAAVFLTLLLLSVVISFARTTHAELLALASFPPYEVELLSDVPLQGWMLSVFFGLPLASTVILAIAAGRSSVSQPPSD
jgi:hypothetical protein